MITAMMLPNLTKIGVLIDFKINQDFIAEALCINKSEPMTVCSGQCYLSEQLKKTKEQEEKRVPTSNKKSLEVTYYLVKGASGSLPFLSTAGDKTPTTYISQKYNPTLIFDIFHPPKLMLV